MIIITARAWRPNTTFTLPEPWGAGRGGVTERQAGGGARQVECQVSLEAAEEKLSLTVLEANRKPALKPRQERQRLGRTCVLSAGLL